MPAPAGRPNVALIFIFITLLLDVMGIGLIIPIMPGLLRHFLGHDVGLTAHYYGILASLFTLTQFLFSPVLGSLSDRFGRKPLLILSLGLTALSYLLMAFAPGVAGIMIARALAGIGGASLTVATAYLADISSAETRAQNFGMVGAAFGLGFIFGPALGGLLGGFGLWVPFYAAAAVAGLNMLFGWWLVPESLALEHRREVGWRHANPLGSVGLLRKYPVVAGLAGALMLASVGHQSLTSVWVLFTEYRFHWTPGANGISLAVVGLCTALVQGGLIRVVMPHLGERRAIYLGMTATVTALVLYGLATAGWMMYAIMVLGSLGGLGGPAMQGLISRQVGPDEQGAIQGALTSLMSLCGVATPLFANYLFAHFTGPRAPLELPGIAFFFGAFCALLALLAVWRVLRRGEAAPQPQPLPVN